MFADIRINRALKLENPYRAEVRDIITTPFICFRYNKNDGYHGIPEGPVSNS